MRHGRRGRRWSGSGRGANDEVAKKRKRYGNFERVCMACGKKFLGRSNAKFCSRKCANKAPMGKNAGDTLCWTCRHATNKYGRCSWSRWGLPVPGWEAIPTKLKAQKGNEKTAVESYIVKSCPIYEEE